MLQLNQTVTASVTTCLPETNFGTAITFMDEDLEVVASSGNATSDSCGTLTDLTMQADRYYFLNVQAATSLVRGPYISTDWGRCGGLSIAGALVLGAHPPPMPGRSDRMPHPCTRRPRPTPGIRVERREAVRPLHRRARLMRMTFPFTVHANRALHLPPRTRLPRQPSQVRPWTCSAAAGPRHPAHSQPIFRAHAMIHRTHAITKCALSALGRGGRNVARSDGIPPAEVVMVAPVISGCERPESARQPGSRDGPYDAAPEPEAVHRVRIKRPLSCLLWDT